MLKVASEVRTPSVSDRNNSNAPRSVVLSEATYTRRGERDKDSSEVVMLKFESLYISGRHITYIHLPDDVNVARTMDAEVRTVSLY